MFRPDRRLFSIASIGLIVVALLHGIGQFAPAPADPALATVLDAMRDYRFDFRLFAMKPTFHDIHDSLSLFMSLALLGWGAQNLLIARTDGPEARVVRAAARASALTFGAVVAMFLVLRIAPPFVTLLVVEILFVLAVFRLRKAGA
jgi:hypothetical protein